MKNKITFIICTMNSIDTIKPCLESVKDYPVILVDKDSKDGTLDVAWKYPNVTIVHQDGKGLANARNEGLKRVKTPYICMFGSDNELIKGFVNIDAFIEYLDLQGWVGFSFKTLVKYKNTYLDKCLDIWWRKRFTEGQREVIGTPCVYKTDILKQFMYDENCTHSDDTDLGARLTKAGYRQGYSPYFVYDISKNRLSDIIDRWSRYAKSDAEYHKKYCKTFKQKVKSYLHPFRTEWIFNLTYLPFYIMISLIRFSRRF